MSRKTPTILKTKTWLALSAFLLLAACGGSDSDADGNRLPSDEQIVSDVMQGDTDNVIDVHTVAGKSGESYLHTADRVWYFDRGVVIKRKAHLADAIDRMKTLRTEYK